MILSTERIRQLVFDSTVEPANRLVITPVLDWSLQAKPGNCSIDVRLGQRFRVPRRARLDMLDHLSDDHSKRIELYADDHHVFIGDYFVVHPRQFVLSETLEWIHLPAGYAAYVIGRSSWGRDGLVIATATGVHSGYSGILTLEITNLGEIPIRLYPGLTIAQLFIHTVDYDVKPRAEAAKSAFAGSTSPESADAVGVKDKKIIKKLSQMYGRKIGA